MKKLRLFLFIFFTSLAISAFPQQLKLSISGYDARCYHSSDGKFSFNIHLDNNGKMQGPVEIYEMVTKNREKDSALVFKGMFLNGHPVELATWYYTNGMLMRRVFFSQSQPESWSDKLCFYDVGDLQLCGKPIGVYIEWYDRMNDTAQQVRKVYNYTNGKENGVQRYYYPSGQLKIEWNMAMGHRDGKYTRWYANGKIEEEGNYKAGFPSGPWREYHENGSLSRTKATRGSDDTIINYYENGKIKNRTYYKGNERHGDYFVYDTLGKVQTYKHFTKGRQDSIQVAYYPSGKKAELLHFNGRDKEGKYEAWYPNGKLKLTGQHINGDPAGIWKKYDEAGKVSPLHYSEVWKETKAFNSSDYDENNPPDTVQEMISIPFEFTRPAVTNADRPVTVLRSDKLKFLKNYSSIDALAVMDAHGKVSFSVVTPLEAAQKEKLENYLNAHFGNGKPMTFKWHEIVAPCTMTVKIIVSGQ